MKYCIIVILLLFLPPHLHAIEKYVGIGLSVNVLYGNAIILPVPSAALYFMNKDRIHGFEVNYATVGNYTEEGDLLLSGRKSIALGINYSYLRNINRFLSIGPVLALQLTTHKYYPSGKSLWANEWYKSKGGLYFFGVKGLFAFKKDNFGLLISETLLAGEQISDESGEEKQALGIYSSIGLGAFYWF